MLDAVDARPESATHQLTTFELGAEEYALDIRDVQEIVRMLPVTKVPRAPAHVEGVINLRGKIIALVDLRRRVGMPPAEATKATRIIIVHQEAKVVGLIVDRVREVLRVDAAAIAPPPEQLATGMDTAFIRAVGQVGERLILLLDLPRLLRHEEFAAAVAVAEAVSEPAAHQKEATP